MQPFSLKLFVLKGPNGHTSSCNSSHLMRLSLVRVCQCTPLCGPPLRRSTEHGGATVRVALAASPSGSSARCGASFARRSRAQRHRSRRRRRAFMWGARSSSGPPGLSLDGTDAGTFDSADSGLGHSPYSKKSFSGAGTLDVTGSGLRHSPYSWTSFTKEAKFDSEAGTL